MGKPNRDAPVGLKCLRVACSHGTAQSIEITPAEPVDPDPIVWRRPVAAASKYSTLRRIAHGFTSNDLLLNRPGAGRGVNPGHRLLRFFLLRAAGNPDGRTDCGRPCERRCSEPTPGCEWGILGEFVRRAFW
ncbi:hypothetical protein ACFL5O_07995 [Myxococcota bacterium]